MEISDKSKQVIDSLSRDEIVYEINLGRKSRFQREKFAYLKTRLDIIDRDESKSIENKVYSEMKAPSSWKEQFENHPIIFGITLIIVGFIAGFGVNEWTRQFRNSPSDIPTIDSQKALSESRIASQIEALTSEHNSRLSALHEELKKNEQESVYGGNLDSSQQKYIQSAERIRASIVEENESYSKQLEQLMKIIEAKSD